jgi:hypothetical protein
MAIYEIHSKTLGVVGSFEAPDARKALETGLASFLLQCG